MELRLWSMRESQHHGQDTSTLNIKYYAIQEWVERDLIILQRIETAIYMADHYTDYNMGRVPPTYSPKYLECLRVYSMPDKGTTKQKEYTARAAKTLAPWDIIVFSLHGATLS